jgi:hypothetical protein
MPQSRFTEDCGTALESEQPRFTMFVKTKERAGRTSFFLCIPERG